MGKMTERDCSDEVELRNGRANTCGWSSAELWHNEEQIGYHNAGAITITHPDYRHVITQEGPQRQRLTVFCAVSDEVLG